MALAYLLDPLADRLERARRRAALVAALIVITAGRPGVIVLLILMVVPVLGGQLAVVHRQHSRTIVRRLQALVTDPSRPWLQQACRRQASERRQVGRRAGDAGRRLARPRSCGSLWSGGQALVSVFSLLVITPVVAFYLLLDWDRMIATVDGWMPLQHRETVRGLAREIDGAIAGFVRGQTLVCLILGSFYAVALTLAGLNFGLLIGLVSGLITLHSLCRLDDRASCCRSASRSRSSGRTGPGSLLVLGIFVVGQFIEGNILSPKLVGESVGLHPVWLMFALLAFGYLFGFVGLLVAVPLAAAIGVLVRFALRQLSGKPALHRRASRADRCADRAQSTSTHAVGAAPARARARSCRKLRARGFSRRAVQRRGARADRALAGLAGAHRRCWSGRRARARAISPRSGRRRRARACCRARALDGADLPDALATGALVVEDLADGALRRARAVPSAQSGARGAAPIVLLTARSAPAAWRRRACRDLASRLRALPVVALAAPDDALLRAVLVKLFADRQLAVDESLVALSGDPDRALVRRRARRRWQRLDREALRQQAAGDPGAGGGAVPGALTA